MQTNLNSITIVLSLFIGLISANANTAESLSKRIHSFHNELKKSTKKVPKNVMREFLPTQKDLEVLFPGQGKKAWSMIEDQVNIFIENADRAAQEIKSKNIIKTKLINSRKNDSPYTETLSSIPRNISVFRAKFQYESRRVGVTSTGQNGCYVYVNNRWVLIHRLLNIAQKLK